MSSVTTCFNPSCFFLPMAHPITPEHWQQWIDEAEFNPIPKIDGESLSPQTTFLTPFQYLVILSIFRIFLQFFVVKAWTNRKIDHAVGLSVIIDSLILPYGFILHIPFLITDCSVIPTAIFYGTITAIAIDQSITATSPAIDFKK